MTDESDAGVEQLAHRIEDAAIERCLGVDIAQRTDEYKAAKELRRLAAAGYERDQALRAVVDMRREMNRLYRMIEELREHVRVAANELDQTRRERDEALDGIGEAVLADRAHIEEYEKQIEGLRAQIADLTERLERTQAACDRWKEIYWRCRDSRDSLQAECERLRENFMHYGYHDSQCATIGGRANQCDCGFSDIYDHCAALEQAQEE